MNKPMTEAELAAHAGISPGDKRRIEELIGLYTDREDPEDQPDYLRAFLVRLFDENEVDQHFRDDLETNAASFTDGWLYCIDYRRQKEGGG